MRYIADKPTSIETNCGVQGHPAQPHVHYVHRWYLAWIDHLIWRYGQWRFKRLVKKNKGVWVADWSDK